MTAIDSAEAWRLNLQLVYGTAQTLSLVPLADMVQQAERAQAIGPMLDPTLWLKNGKAAREDLEVLKAALAFVSTIREASRRAAPPASGPSTALRAGTVAS